MDLTCGLFATTSGLHAGNGEGLGGLQRSSPGPPVGLNTDWVESRKPNRSGQPWKSGLPSGFCWASCSRSGAFCTGRAPRSSSPFSVTNSPPFSAWSSGAKRIPYGLRYPHEYGSIVIVGLPEWSLALRMAPSQTPRIPILPCSGPTSNALTVAPGRKVWWAEYPLVTCVSGTEVKPFWLSLMS